MMNGAKEESNPALTRRAPKAVDKVMAADKRACPIKVPSEAAKVNKEVGEVAAVMMLVAWVVAAVAASTEARQLLLLLVAACMYGKGNDAAGG